MLNITKYSKASSLKFTLEGRLDTNTAPELEAQVRDALTGITDLEFDIGKLEYISSAGLRVLLSCQKIMNKQQGNMVISNASEEVKEIFDVTGFTDILTLK